MFGWIKQMLGLMDEEIPPAREKRPLSSPARVVRARPLTSRVTREQRRAAFDDGVLLDPLNPASQLDTSLFESHSHSAASEPSSFGGFDGGRSGGAGGGLSWDAAPSCDSGSSSMDSSSSSSFDASSSSDSGSCGGDGGGGDSSSW